MTGASVKTASALREQAIDLFLQQRDRPDDMVLAADLEAWLAADEQHAAAFERVRCLMGDAGLLVTNDHAFVVRATRKSSLTNGKIATTVAFAVTLAAGLYLADIPMRLRADYMSDTAERQIVTTPDGSTITLNANSAIALRFTATERQVLLLRGEIFAQVAPDAMRPFSVVASGGTTTALGTAFDVNMQDGTTNVAVLEHSVSVDLPGQHDASRLQENQQVSYKSDGTIGAIEAVDPTSIGAWRHGRFVFEDKSLAEVVGAFQRYIPGRIIVTQEKLRQKRLSGNFDLSDPQAALIDLATALDVRVMTAGPFLTVLY